MVTGCASLPGGVQRPASQARTDLSDTRLAVVAAASMPAGSRLSGMRLLPAGDQAFEARIALTRSRQRRSTHSTTRLPTTHRASSSCVS